MAVCTFFGHGDTPEEIAPALRSILIDLIENKDVNMFYVGDSGAAQFKALAEKKGKVVINLVNFKLK